MQISIHSAELWCITSFHLKLHTAWFLISNSAVVPEDVKNLLSDVSLMRLNIEDYSTPYSRQLILCSVYLWFPGLLFRLSLFMLLCHFNNFYQAPKEESTHLCHEVLGQCFKSICVGNIQFACKTVTCTGGVWLSWSSFTKLNREQTWWHNWSFPLVLMNTWWVH